MINCPTWVLNPKKSFNLSAFHDRPTPEIVKMIERSGTGNDSRDCDGVPLPGLGGNNSSVSDSPEHPSDVGIHVELSVGVFDEVDDVLNCLERVQVAEGCAIVVAEREVSSVCSIRV